MRLTGERTISNEEVQATLQQLQEQKVTKGAGIRTLFAGGLDVKEISALTGIRYNHVYNVVNNEVIVQGLEVERGGRSNENSKRAQIVKLLQSGKTINETAVELKVLYNYVWKVAKEEHLTNKQKDAVVIAAEATTESKATKSTKVKVG